MKIAVLGSGPVALEAALDFFQEGADVRIIGTQNPAFKLQFLAENFPTFEINPEEYVRFETLEFLGDRSLDQMNTFEGLWIFYYAPLIEYLKKENIFHPRQVLRIQKQFLDPNEQIEGRTRLHDLFRVTYGLNPSGMVEEQLKENPELKEKLGDDILNSLKNQVESFEDFDLVFDARGPFQAALPMGAGHHYALNEEIISKLNDIYYGVEAWKNFEKLKGHQSLTLVGSGIEAAYIFLSLKDWLEEENHVLNIVSTETALFSRLLKDPDIPDGLKTSLKELIKSHMSDWKNQCLEVEIEIHAWRELPPHEKVKVDQPQFPAPRLRLYEGYTVTSLDKLMDREGLFVTLEIPPWRDSEKQELVTLAQDALVGAVGHEPDASVLGRLPQDELGYFSLESTSGKLVPESSLKRIPLIKSEVLKYFSKA